MEGAGGPARRRPFKEFAQYVAPTRVVSGRGLLDSAGFEFMKEGAKRVLVVTDRVIHDTGLVDRVAAGVVNGGLELADRAQPGFWPKAMAKVQAIRPSSHSSCASRMRSRLSSAERLDLA